MFIQKRKGLQAGETAVCVKTRPLGTDEELCVTANEEASKTRGLECTVRQEPQYQPQAGMLSISFLLPGPCLTSRARYGPLRVPVQGQAALPLCCSGPLHPMSTAGAQLEVLTLVSRKAGHKVFRAGPLSATDSLSDPGLLC